jgi:hypothetical protein
VSIRFGAKGSRKTREYANGEAGGNHFLQLVETIQFSKSIQPPSRGRAISNIANQAGRLRDAPQVIAGVDFQEKEDPPFNVRRALRLPKTVAAFETMYQ